MQRIFVIGLAVLLSSHSFTADLITGRSNVELINLKASLEQGKSEILQVNLPSDVLSISIYVFGAQKHSYLITDASMEGEIITSEQSMEKDVPADLGFDTGERFSLNRSIRGPTPGTGHYMAPNNPRVILKPGLFAFRIKGCNYDNQNIPAEGPVSVSVAIKRYVGEPQQGRLALHLYFSGSNGFTKKTVIESPLMQGAIKVMQDYLDTMNIELDIYYHSVKTKMSGPANPKEYVQLAALGKHKSGIAMYFTENLDGPGFWGLSGGGPGPVVISGQKSNGVFIATNRLVPDNEQEVGNTMAHELAHYLGIEHVFNVFNGTAVVEDQFSDTTMTDGNPMHSGNVNFVAFSQQQMAVALRHPAVVIGPK